MASSALPSSHFKHNLPASEMEETPRPMNDGGSNDSCRRWDETRQNQHTRRHVTAYNRNVIKTRAYVDRCLGPLFNFLKAHKRPVSKSQWNEARSYHCFYVDSLEPILVTQDEAAIRTSILQKLLQSDHVDSSSGSNVRVPALPLIVWGTLDYNRTSDELTSLVAASESKGRMLEDMCQRYGIPHLRLENLNKLRGLFAGQAFGRSVMGLFVTKFKPEFTVALESIQREASKANKAIASLIRYRQGQEQHDQSRLAVRRHSEQEESDKRTSLSNHQDAELPEMFPIAIAESSSTTAAYDGPSLAPDVVVYPDALDSESVIAAACISHGGQEDDESPSFKKQRTHYIPTSMSNDGGAQICKQQETFLATSTDVEQQLPEKKSAKAMAIPQVATFLETSKHSEGLLYEVAASKTSSMTASKMSPSANTCDVADECLGIGDHDEQEQALAPCKSAFHEEEGSSPQSAINSSPDYDKLREEEERPIKETLLKGEIDRLEKVLSDLASRKQSLAQELQTAGDQFRLLTEEVPSLESHISNLKSTLNDDTKVHEKILRSLAQSHGSMARLLGSDMSVEEIIQLANEQEIADRELDSFLAERARRP